MAVTVRSASKASLNRTDGVAVAAPAGLQVGDRMVAVSTDDRDSGSLANLTGPAGWTEIGSLGLAGVGYVKMWAKTAAAGDIGATYTFGTSSVADSNVGIVAFPGADPAATLTPVWSSSTTSSASHPAPSVTGAVGAQLLTVHFGGATSTTTRSYTPPTGMVEQVDTTASGGSWVVLGMNTLALTSTAGTGTKTATCSHSVPRITASLVIPAAPPVTTVSAALTGSGTLSATVATGPTQVTALLSGTGQLTAVVQTDNTVSARLHQWSMFARTPAYAPSEPLPIISAKILKKHLGVSKASVVTPFTPAAWEALQPSNGVVVYRDGAQEFSGLIDELGLDWDAENGRAVINAGCVGDEQHLADRLVFPDSLRAADDQTVNDYWTWTSTASAAMVRLISDQAGPTCRADRRIPGLLIGPDPGVGVTRTWSGLFSNVLEELARISVASGADLGLRTSTSPGVLHVDVVQPRNRGDIKFSADLSNLGGIGYRLASPTVTHALSAGQGDLHLRARTLSVTDDPDTLAWGRQIWSYIDRRDTAETDELATAAEDGIAAGGPTVSLASTLLDSDAATYGTDWQLGDRVTVYVGLPGQVKVATVTDVIREISLEVSESGAEQIRPAIGSYDAKAIVPTPTQQQLRTVSAGLSGLITRK